MKYKALAAIASTLLFAGTAEATVTVQIWANQSGAANNATLAQAAGLGAADGTTTVSAINFDTSPAGCNCYTIGGFLNNPGGLSPSLASAALNNTYMLLSGQLFLNAGNNSFVVSHDDGLQLNIGGIGMVVNQPGPTSPVNTPFNVNAPSAGLYNFQLSYGECCGPPAKLVFAVNGAPVGGVPEPATWAMMLLGFGAIGVAVRRGRRNQGLQQIS